MSDGLSSLGPVTTTVWVALTKDLIKWYKDTYPDEDSIDPKVAAVALSAAEFNVLKARENLVARMQATPLTPDEEMLQLRGIEKDKLITSDDYPTGDPSNQRENWLKAKKLAISVADDLETAFGETLWKAMLGSRGPPDSKDTGGAKLNRGKAATSIAIHPLHKPPIEGLFIQFLQVQRKYEMLQGWPTEL